MSSNPNIARGKKKKRGLEVPPALEQLPSKCEILSLSPSTAKKERREQENKKQKKGTEILASC
jgi:hypothetical protein